MSLSSQTFRDFEVVLVDNCSTDGCVDNLAPFLTKLDLNLQRSKRNIGFAAANNLGARLARGPWLATLNPDAFPEPDWLANLFAAGEVNPDCFFASRQVQAGRPNRLDGEGDAYHVSGLAWRRNYGLPVTLSPQPIFQDGEGGQEKFVEVFSPCAAAALYPRRDFLEAGGFDEDFFAYHEDVDLGFRLRLRGLRCLFVPSAIVHHHGSASTGKLSDFIIYHGHRNLVWTYFKNMPFWLFWLYLPLHLAMNMFFLVSFTLKGQAPAIFRAKKDAVRGLVRMIQKRRSIQRERRVPAGALLRIMEADPLAPLKVRSIRRRFGAD